MVASRVDRPSPRTRQLVAASLVAAFAMSLVASGPFAGGFAAVIPNSLVGGSAPHPASAAAVVPAVASGGGNVTVTFKELGLPGGAVWSVTAGSPPATQTNTTVGHRGQLRFSEPNGTLTYAVTGPAGFGIEKIVGRGGPTLTSDAINGTTTLSVVFSVFEELSFQEQGLPAGSAWSVAIWSSFPHGGPTGQSGSSIVSAAGGWINFTVVRGPWKFNVTSVPTNFTVTPHHGTVGVGAHNVTRELRFRAIPRGHEVGEPLSIAGVPRGLIGRAA